MGESCTCLDPSAEYQNVFTHQCSVPVVFQCTSLPRALVYARGEQLTEIPTSFLGFPWNSHGNGRYEGFIHSHCINFSHGNRNEFSTAGRNEIITVPKISRLNSLCPPQLFCCHILVHS